MNIAAEKKAIIKRFDEVHDVSLIKAIKNLLDFGLSNQSNSNDAVLERAIEEGIRQADNGEVLPHKEVWAEIRNRYKA